jgi:hypothetical protein
MIEGLGAAGIAAFGDSTGFVAQEKRGAYDNTKIGRSKNEVSEPAI